MREIFFGGIKKQREYNLTLRLFKSGSKALSHMQDSSREIMFHFSVSTHSAMVRFSSSVSLCAKDGMRDSRS